MKGAIGGLRNAVGCYILAVSSGSASIPWYVGKTVRAGFEKEAFESHKRKHYEGVLKDGGVLNDLRNGTVELYLIPRVSSTGKPRKKFAGNGKQDGKISVLEERLIGSALAINPSLANVKSKRQIQLPGYMNESAEGSAAAVKLAKLLKTKLISKRNAART